MIIDFRYTNKYKGLLTFIIFILILSYDFDLQYIMDLTSRQRENFIMFKFGCATAITYIIMLFSKNFLIKKGTFKLYDNKVYIKANKKIEIELSDLFMVNIDHKVENIAEYIILTFTYKGKSFKITSEPMNPNNIHNCSFYMIYAYLKGTDRFSEHTSIVNVSSNSKRRIERTRYCLKRK